MEFLIYSLINKQKKKIKEAELKKKKFFFIMGNLKAKNNSNSSLMRCVIEFSRYFCRFL